MSVDFSLILQPGWRVLEPLDTLIFNRRAISMLSPEFTTLWTEDYFQKDASPALEAWITLSFMPRSFRAIAWAIWCSRRAIAIPRCSPR